SITHAGHKSSTGVLAKDVSIGPALPLEHVLNDAGKPLANRTKEVMPGIEDLARRVAPGLRILVARIVIGLAGWRTVGPAVARGRRSIALGRRGRSITGR